MNEPTYKPTTWIAFALDTQGGFGQIVGAHFDGTQWHYIVSGSLENGALRVVPHHTITYALQNGSWMPPTTFGGQNSAYTTPDAA
jgi:hypothetical protein